MQPNVALSAYMPRNTNRTTHCTTPLLAFNKPIFFKTISYTDLFWTSITYFTYLHLRGPIPAAVKMTRFLHPSRPVDVQWTSIERPYQTCGRPKVTFNGRLVDVPSGAQLVRPNRTKMDVHFKPSRDALHGTSTSSEPPSDVH